MSNLIALFLLYSVLTEIEGNLADITYSMSLDTMNILIGQLKLSKLTYLEKHYKDLLSGRKTTTAILHS